jgi:hypothetical protein
MAPDGSFAYTPYFDQQADHEAIWELHKIALQDAGADLGSGQWDDDLRPIDQVYLQNQGEFLVGVYEGRIVAIGALTTNERAETKRMRVHPHFQRCGFGHLRAQSFSSPIRYTRHPLYDIMDAKKSKPRGKGNEQTKAVGESPIWLEKYFV